LRGAERLRGKAEANSEIPRFHSEQAPQSKKRDCRALRDRNDNAKDFIALSI